MLRSHVIFDQFIGSRELMPLYIIQYCGSTGLIETDGNYIVYVKYDEMVLKLEIQSQSCGIKIVTIVQDIMSEDRTVSIVLVLQLAVGWGEFRMSL